MNESRSLPESVACNPMGALPSESIIFMEIGRKGEKITTYCKSEGVEHMMKSYPGGKTRQAMSPRVCLLMGLLLTFLNFRKAGPDWLPILAVGVG